MKGSTHYFHSMYLCVCASQLVTHGDRALSAITAPTSLRRPLTIMLLLPWLQIHSFHSICIWREGWRQTEAYDEKGTEEKQEIKIFILFFSCWCFLFSVLSICCFNPHMIPCPFPQSDTNVGKTSF